MYPALLSNVRKRRIPEVNRAWQYLRCDRGSLVRDASPSTPAFPCCGYLRFTGSPRVAVPIFCPCTLQRGAAWVTCDGSRAVMMGGIRWRGNASITWQKLLRRAVRDGGCWRRCTRGRWQPPPPATAAADTGPDIAAASNGGVATASANGGGVGIGNINSGGNAGNAIGVGDTVGSVGVAGGDVGNATGMTVTADGGTRRRIASTRDRAPLLDTFDAMCRPVTMASDLEPCGCDRPLAPATAPRGGCW